MRELGVGLIGPGEMGRRHAENLRYRVPGARLVAVADVDRDRARAVAGELNVPACFGSAGELLAHPGIEAVVISSPPKYHAPAIVAAAQAGKQIFCEKPLALTVADADAALDAVEHAGVLLQVGHMRRYDPPYAQAWQRIQAGDIGRVVLFKSIGRDQESSLAAASQIGVNGTLFHDSSSHDFDLARWLTADEVVEVHAYAAALALPELAAHGAFDCGVVNLRFAGGAIGNVESFMHAQYGYDVRTEVVGTLGTLQIGYLRQTPLVALTRSGSRHDLLAHWLTRFADAYLLEMQDFIAAVQAGAPPRVSGYDGRQSLAVAEAAVESWREARPVRLPPARIRHATLTP